MALLDQPNIVCQSVRSLQSFLPLTASMTMEVKNNYTDVTMQNFLNGMDYLVLQKFLPKFKLRLQDLSFFDHLPLSVYIFYGIKVYKKFIYKYILSTTCFHNKEILSYPDFQHLSGTFQPIRYWFKEMRLNPFDLQYSIPQGDRAWEPCPRGL